MYKSIHHMGSDRTSCRKKGERKKRTEKRGQIYFPNFGLNIPFQADGKIVPTPESCPDIFKALLDHRLKSHFSEKIYDVQNTAETGI
ncbi:hypothetical protein [Pseudomonas gingeri]